MQFLVFLLQFQMTMMHQRNNKPIVKRWTSFFHFDVSVGVDEWVLGASFSLYITLLNIRIQMTRSNVFRFCFLFLTPAFSSISFFHDLIFCIRYDAKLCYLRIQMWQEHSLDMFTDMELTLCCLVEDQEMAFPGDSQIVLSIIINLKWKCVSRQVLLYLTSLSIVRCCSLKKSVLLGIVMRR
jgi:hypothetical protein